MKWKYDTYGIPDDMFIRGKVPMTKEEVRSITMSKLRLNKDSTIVDIGAGTGSVSIECGLFAKKGMVYAIERKDDGVNIINENINKFKLSNVKVIKGLAPGILDNVPKIDRAIIGGSGGKLVEIFDWLDKNLKKEGRLVINLITIENIYKALDLIKSRGYTDIDVAQINVSKGRFIKEYTLMEGNNPVYVISAEKK
ncbi:precorrin-6Y C5,15-methyltransferase (decarboxylating) subunit CbiT [Dethiothermospora halolimnae]|uniref:precorrin-6Y C5,15-methyltransferase (decarboxylating) subunit CbiT n=1 Tax=Dethiothermospora halolimnae TaxID=3114390 RepID=UPI003CCC1F02